MTSEKGGTSVRRKSAILSAAVVVSVFASMLAICAPASAYTFSVNDGQYWYASWYWTTPEPVEITLTVDVTAISRYVDYWGNPYGLLDVYFMTKANYDIYVAMGSLGSSFQYMTGGTGVGYGLHTYSCTLYPTVNAYYFLVIDNTNYWNTVACESASGTYSMVDVNLNNPPVASLSLSKSQVTLGEQVTADASGSYDSDANDYISSYLFTTSDGYSSGWTGSSTTTFSWNDPADVGQTVTVSVKVKDRWGIESTTASRTLSIVASAYAISGHVYKAGTTTGISGASLSLSPGAMTATTDSSGYYSMSGVANGVYTMTVSATGYDTLTESGITVSGAAITKDFQLQAVAPSTYTLSGTVSNADTATPISGASISLAPGGKMGTSDSTGHYTIGGLANNVYTATVSASSYTTLTQSVTISGADVSRNFELQPASSGGYTVSGYVYKSGTTTGIAGATVTLTGGKSATTDSSGHYSITGVPAGTYTVAITATGYNTATLAGFTVQGDMAHDFSLTPKTSLPPGGDGNDEKTSALSGPALAGIVAAAAVVAGVAVILLLRRRKGGEQPTSAPPAAQIGAQAPPPPPPPPPEGWQQGPPHGGVVP